MLTVPSRRPVRGRATAAALALGAVAAGASAAAPAATAASPSGAAQRIYVCVTADFGTLNLSGKTAACPRGQRKMSWQVEGLRGEPGPRGAAGPRGPAGPRGASGPQGPAGPQGPVGAPGAGGAKGDAGAPGTPGARGEQGPAGSGAPGPQGIPGPVGPAGPQGPQGLVGPVGPIGPQGIQGDPGRAGADGRNGVAGADGRAGPAGPSGGFPADAAWISDSSGQVVPLTGALTFGGQENLGANVTHAAGSGRVTVGSAGRYVVRFHVNLENGTSGSGSSEVMLSVNNAGVPGSATPVFGNRGSATGEVILNLAAGDWLGIFNSASGTLTFPTGAVGASLVIERIA